MPRERSVLCVSRHGSNTDRDFRLALRAVAGRVLSAGFGAQERAAPCGLDLLHHRDQRLVLFAATAGELRALACGNACRLREKLGPILWQFPPNLRYDEQRVGDFLRLLPKDTRSALRIARKHDERLKGRARLAIDRERPLRHAFEIRHESFCTPSFMKLLRENRVALVVGETARRWPMLEDVTADFMYLRLHGDKELYRSGYDDKALERWAARIRAWHRGSEPPEANTCSSAKPPTSRPRDMYVYFDNTEVKLRAPFDAQRLISKIGAPPIRRINKLQ